MLSIKRRVVTIAVAILAATGGIVGAPASSLAVAGSTVYATGLNNPRGLHFGPDGQLYVAEGGTGGSMMTTSAQCQQVPKAGPYTGGFTSRISRIDRNGTRSTVVDGLPSSTTSPEVGSFVSGVADLAFLGGRLYGMEAGAGCSHGLLGTDNTVFRVNRDGSTTEVADLSAFVKANPTAHENAGDFEPDESWYGMVSARGALYVVGPNHGEVDRVTRRGHMSRLIDTSAAAYPLGLGNPQGHIVPTAITFHDGAFYLVNLDVFDPGYQDSSRVFRITADGQMESVADGLNAAVGVEFDREGRLYVLEAFTGFFAPAPFTANTGKVVRLNEAGGWDTIATGLSFPTAMTFGPDGALYVSNYGFGFAPGAGQILRIAVPTDD